MSPSSLVTSRVARLLEVHPIKTRRPSSDEHAKSDTQTGSGWRGATRGVFPFLCLPAELRNIIYSHAFCGPTGHPRELHGSLQQCPAHGARTPVVTMGAYSPARCGEESSFGRLERPRFTQSGDENGRSRKKGRLGGHGAELERYYGYISGYAYAFLSTCQQIDREATAYAYNSIIVPCDHQLVKVLHTLRPSTRGLIRHIHVRLDPNIHLQHSSFNLLWEEIWSRRVMMPWLELPNLECLWVDAEDGNWPRARPGGPRVTKIHFEMGAGNSFAEESIKLWEAFDEFARDR